VGQPGNGSFFGVDALPSNDGVHTVMLAVGRTLQDGTFAAISQICESGQL
jgi:hypothetical protein